MNKFIDSLLDVRLYDVPFFTNHCKHSKKEYIGSVSTDIQTDINKIDVYIFNNKTKDKLEICIRFGENGSEYFSPGNFLDYINQGKPFGKGCLEIMFQMVVKLLEEKTKISIKKNF